ncbi:MAG: YbdK family carboxylate-amine ligase [Solirubrobacterales bacterium]|jgi:carboxylate-amine ligase|nr:YbdK family carboxylate-amine ligase [Solirubrobacterales bacterium]
MDEVREVFDASTDFTIGLEEEFAILDPESLDLVDRYPELYEAARQDPVLAESAAGELIASEIEIRSGRSESMNEAVAKQEEKRRHLFAIAARKEVALASLGTHPWADYLEQEIIDTPHYQRLKKDLGWVAKRNNTWSLHVHMGIRGADRAIAVCDRLRELLPILLAASANSIFLDRQDTGLASIRTEIFTRTFPRCGVPGTFRDWDEYTRFIDDLKQFGSIVEATQLWWSVRPHHAFGTVEVRICDAQTTAQESTALAGLICAVVAQTAIDLDEGRQVDEPLRGRQIEENLWRAIRHGLDGQMIDFRGRREIETVQMLEEVLEWTGPARSGLGIDVELPERNGARRMRDQLEAGSTIEEIYRSTVEETTRTYSA